MSFQNICYNTFMKDLSKNDIKFILNENNLLPKKSLGQNFLYDTNVLDKIVAFSEVGSSDHVLEIGPGLGTLTSHLLDTGATVKSIEIDKNFYNYLNDRFASFDNFNLIEGDFLKIYGDEIDKIKDCNKCVANLPYYITSPIIMKLLSLPFIKEINIMIQKEVCDRIFAKPSTKDYGVLTLAIEYHAKAMDKFIVSRGSFFPEPNVDSAVIKLVRHDIYTSKNINEKFLFTVIKGSFSQRRKKLANALSSTSHIDKKLIIDALNHIGFNENARAENLSIDDYITLSSLIDQK